MTVRCELTGKRRQFGKNTPPSLHRTNRDWKPNIQRKTFVLEGRKVRMNLSTQAIRMLKKKGIF